MSEWRVIITDSESASGVAPVCPKTDTLHTFTIDDHLTPRVDAMGVYDCCPQPHLECWSERNAFELAHALTIAGVEVCT